MVEKVEIRPACLTTTTINSTGSRKHRILVSKLIDKFYGIIDRATNRQARQGLILRHAGAGIPSRSHQEGLGYPEAAQTLLHDVGGDGGAVVRLLWL